MKIKWNWGTKLFIWTALFMLVLMTFVFLSTKQTFFLVEKDYYPKGLEYQQKIDKMNNTSQLEEKIKVDNNMTFILLTFPKIMQPENIQGTIVFYRPSDGDKDIGVAINPDSLSHQSIPTDDLIAGKYIIQFDYSYKGVDYYQEETLFIK
jgi:hypothetical protein